MKNRIFFLWEILMLPLLIGEAKVLVKWKFFICEMLRGVASEE